ncbi:MAG: hypothetical protein ABIJ33_02200 [Patescibacteria group bacterium]
MVTSSTNQPLNKIEKLLASSQNVFTTQDLAVIWGVTNAVSLHANIQYYVGLGKIKRIHKGIYVVREYTSFEFAQKIVTPSYISFYSALVAHGIVFQLYTSIHSASLISKKINISQEKFVYHKLKEQVFSDSIGIENMSTYLIAGPERAICDSLYLYSGLAFDNLRMIDFDVLRKISKIYHNQRLEQKIESIIRLEKL